MAAQLFANIMAQSSDISSAGAMYPHLHSGQIHLKDRDLMDHHRAGFPLHFFSSSRQITELLSIDFQRGIHGRYLLIRSLKGEDRFPHFLF